MNKLGQGLLKGLKEAVETEDERRKTIRKLIREANKIIKETNKMSKKVKISSKALNELISKMSKHENAFGKLNAGQKREQAKSVLHSLLECSASTQAEIASAMIRSV